MWVPALDDVLEGLSRTMERAVIPAIEDPYARMQAMSVSMRLLNLAQRWEAIGEWAAIENEEMRAGLAACAQALHASGQSDEPPEEAALVRDILGQMARLYPPDPPRRSLASLADESQDLGLLMEDAILRLEAMQQAHSANENLASAREALRRVIRAQAERRDPGMDSSEIQHPN